MAQSQLEKPLMSCWKMSSFGGTITAGKATDVSLKNTHTILVCSGLKLGGHLAKVSYNSPSSGLAVLEELYQVWQNNPWWCHQGYLKLGIKCLWYKLVVWSSKTRVITRQCQVKDAIRLHNGIQCFWSRTHTRDLKSLCFCPQLLVSAS